jgi:hypothetical protein
MVLGEIMKGGQVIENLRIGNRKLGVKGMAITD